MRQTEYVQADLRFLMPIHPGQRVAIIGNALDLAEALKEENIRIELIERAAEKIPLKDCSVDHVIIPILDRHQTSWFTFQIFRILKPGGWLLVGLHNAEGLHRLFFWKNDIGNGAPAFKVRSCEKTLKEAGFAVLTSFGVRKDLKSPQFLIPLDNKETAHFYFQRIFFPSSRAAATAQKLAALITLIGLQRILFGDIAVVAQKNTGMATP